MKKILYLAIIFVIFLLSSCSTTRDRAYLNSQKLKTIQELVKQENNKKSELANESINGSTAIALNTKCSDTTIINSIKKHSAKISPSVRASVERITKGKFVKTTKQDLHQTLALSNIGKNLNNLVKKQTYASRLKNSQLSDDDYLKLWITFLIIALVCFILAIIFYFAFLSLIEEIFDILGTIASIPAIIFFVLWLLDEMK